MKDVYPPPYFSEEGPASAAQCLLTQRDGTEEMNRKPQGEEVDTVDTLFYKSISELLRLLSLWTDAWAGLD